MAKPRKIKIFDTTLRDGEQSPGATLSHQEKIIIAKHLEKMNVDIIEAGFPIASEDDFKAVRDISKEIKKSEVAGLARVVEKDIDRLAKALEPAKKPRIHVVLATSPIHREFKLKKSPKEIIQMGVAGVKYASQFCKNIEFSPEDASRTETAFLYEVLEKTIEAGATTVNIPDTVGYAQPAEFGNLISGIIENVPNIEQATISVHCHNDLGLAVSNSLEAVRHGAGQVECAVNGIGERAGNAALEELAMALKTRSSYYSAETNLNLSEIYRVSQMVSSFTGLLVQRNKAVVGENAFAHESGIHQHGVLCKREAYEIMDPKMIGKESELVLGKHSGKHAVKSVLKEMGYGLKENQVEEITSRIKALADKQKRVFREDIVAIANDVTDQMREEDKRIVLEEVKIFTGNRVQPEAEVSLKIDGKQVVGKAKGVGPVDASAKAIASVISEKVSLKEYNLKAITGGTDALANVVIKVKNSRGKEFLAEAINEDVIMASVEAIINGYNKALFKEGKPK